MSRINPVDPTKASGKTSELLDLVSKNMGMVPNIIKALANSPAALGAYLNFSGELASGSLSAKLRERVSLAVSQKNGCDYCVAAHVALGKMNGLSADEIRDARRGSATCGRDDAAVKFAVGLIEKQGNMTDKDLRLIRNAGYGDGELAELVALVALNIFTNYFNHVAHTEIDFPEAEPVK